MTSLAVVVMAAPARAAWAEEVAAKVGAPIVWDRYKIPSADPARRWEVGARAWRKVAREGADWSCVIQDDALVCRDFTLGFARALENFDGSGLVSAYMGRPKSPSTTRAVQQVGGSSWAYTAALNWGVCFAAPTRTVKDMLDWTSNPERDAENYDYRIGRYYREVVGWRTYYTHPSLVDHRDEGSLVGHGGQLRRVAHKFIGEDVSAFTVDWGNGPDVGFDPTIPISGPYTNPYRRGRVRIR